MLAGALALGACGIGIGGDGPTGPNFIVITLDDATTDQVSEEAMPVAMREIAGEGTIFDRFIVPMPLCCPSRAAFLTGQYGHNNGVLRNNYRKLDSKSKILPRWLQDAGYRTMHVGKHQGTRPSRGRAGRLGRLVHRDRQHLLRLPALRRR